jgi:hypothetical protein
VKRADFRAFYREAHGVTCLSEREKMLQGGPVQLFLWFFDAVEIMAGDEKNRILNKKTLDSELP